MLERFCLWIEEVIINLAFLIFCFIGAVIDWYRHRVSVFRED